MVKMYLSHFEVAQDIKRHNDYKLKFSKLMEGIRKLGIEIIYINDFKGYDEIESTISKCDCLLAIVDEYWTSSTWKVSEVTYANGDGGSGMTNNPRISPRPIFIFPIYESVKLEFLNQYQGPIVLPSNVEEALNIIEKKLI